ncbi:hypothetical protein [Tsukamurella tyrosinosolvens]|uniref:hypothetical protein n=1 Tax=Tsukamurella tyrosinosolvens TaxID=57704 RepID=UPI0015F1BC81|nr:hypothetical protein [Tsukamurella tyrosinosolvens]
MNTQISRGHARATILLAAAAAAVGISAIGPAGAANAGPTPTQSCPASGLVFVCGKYVSEADCLRDLNARGGWIAEPHRKLACWAPSKGIPDWELVAPIDVISFD